MKSIKKYLAILLGVLILLFSGKTGLDTLLGTGTDPVTTSEPSFIEVTPEPTMTAAAVVEAEPSPSPESTVAQPTAHPEVSEDPVSSITELETIAEDGEYDQKDDVALYLFTYGHLPSNFMTKKEARSQGWENGALNTVIPGKSIGGDVFGNNEGTLPKVKGRKYYECDIDTGTKKKRGSKRIVYSDDGLIYYTEDHYETFELLYGEE